MAKKLEIDDPYMFGHLLIDCPSTLPLKEC